MIDILSRHKLAKYHICMIRNKNVMHYFIQQASWIKCEKNVTFLTICYMFDAFSSHYIS